MDTTNRIKQTLFLSQAENNSEQRIKRVNLK